MEEHVRIQSRYRGFLVCCYQYYNDKRLFGDCVVVVSTCDAAYALDIGLMLRLAKLGE